MAERISSTDRVHALLREAIVSGELESGSFHSIYQMAERFEVSRTPMRDAVLRLADAGLVQIERNRGVRIRGLSVADIRDIFESRLLLEVPAAGYAAEHAPASVLSELQATLEATGRSAVQGDVGNFTRHDRDLHNIVMLATGNTRLAGIVGSLRDTTQALGASTFNRSRDLGEVQREHVPIVAAIVERNAAEARAQMTAHLETTGLLLMNQVAAVTNEPVPEGWPSASVASAG